jgi:energy-coupling factor transporter ATP-binding protein EcfA2
VEGLIQSLALGKCADTLIGSKMIAGLSGGEKKRTAVGVELISDPTLLFLDEPTSGLDSYAAFKLTEVLRGLAQSGRTVITTIHQPSSEVFGLFDEAILLVGGKCLYMDRVDSMTGYFTQMGHTCPPNFNPADFVMFLMQQQPQEEMERMVLAWEDSPAGKYEDETGGKGVDKAKVQKKAGFATQFVYLARREAQGLIRNRAGLIAQFGTGIFLNLLIGIIFMGAADWSSTEVESAEVFAKVNSNFGALVQVAISAMFGLSQPALLNFPLERPVFLREYAVGTYGVIPYFISKMLVEIPMMLLQVTVQFACNYWLIGFNCNFFLLVLLVTLLGSAAASTSILIGSISSDVTVAVQLTPLLFVPQLLFAGFFIPINEIPFWLRWPQYLCTLKYSLNLLMLLEFGDVKGPVTYIKGMLDQDRRTDLYQDAVFGCHGDELLDTGVCTEPFSRAHDIALFPRSEVVPSALGMYLGVLFCVMLAFRLLAMGALVKKSSD